MHTTVFVTVGGASSPTYRADGCPIAVHTSGISSWRCMSDLQGEIVDRCVGHRELGTNRCGEFSIATLSGMQTLNTMFSSQPTEWRSDSVIHKEESLC